MSSSPVVDAVVRSQVARPPQQVTRRAEHHGAHGGEGVRFVLADPEQLGGGAGRLRHVADGLAPRAAEPRGQRGELGGGPQVGVEQRGACRAAVPAEQYEVLHLTGDGERRRRWPARPAPAHRGHECPPPVVRLLLGAPAVFGSGRPSVFTVRSGAHRGLTLFLKTNSRPSVTRRFSTGGGQYQFFFDSQRLTSDSGVTQLSPFYSATVGMTFTQPLLRDRSIDLARHDIRVQRKRLTQSDIDFRLNAIALITQVQQDYWELVFALRDQQNLAGRAVIDVFRYLGRELPSWDRRIA